MKSTARILLLVLSILLPDGFSDNNQILAQSSVGDPPFTIQSTPWADSVIKTLSDEEKIAQLFMVAAYSNKGEDHLKELTELVEKYKIGGLIFFQGGPVRQARMTNILQSKSKTPLFIAMDAEWGLAMRLDSTMKYPWQMTLGAVQDDALLYQMGKDIGEQMNRLGVHINFAPVVDVNVNPNNPVINARSFGEDRKKVAEKGIAYMKGLQYRYVLANAKHFPGHGDTDKDSHKTLPIINHKKERLDSVELYPFRELMNNGLSSVMVAHLFVPAYVEEFNQATTLSTAVVNGLLKDSMQFKGLVFTDALNMKGVSERYEPGEVDLRALQAGNDVLLFAEDVPKAISEIQQAIKKDKLSMEVIEERCLKILRAKEWAGLPNMDSINEVGLVYEINEQRYKVLNRKLIDNSLTVIRNEENLLPLVHLDTLSIAHISVGKEKTKDFQEGLMHYTHVDHFKLPDEASQTLQKKLLDSLQAYDLVIVSLHQSDVSPFKKLKITESTKDFMNVLRLRKKVIIDLFGNPYSLIDFEAAQLSDAVIVSYQNNKNAQDLSAQLIFGGISSSGKLPVTISKAFPVGHGVDIESISRLNYRLPEEMNIRSSDLRAIDSIALAGIREGAYPGCQILVAKSGSVIYNKAFGYHTYDSIREVRNTDIYDLASITKIASTLLAVMKLNDEGKIELDKYLCDYLPELVDTTEFANLSIREILAHQAGLPAWIPFYKNSLHKGAPRYDIYSLKKSDYYNKRVAENLYIVESYKDTIMKAIIDKGLSEEKEYLYSDLGYYFLKMIVEKKTGMSINEYVDRTVYRSIGNSGMGFNPRMKQELDRIVPTENDLIFRHQQIHGDVHDPGAAMLGGVGGHAGLFASANDLAKIMQMYLDEGYYGGVQYIKDSVVKEFTKCQYCEDDNRRGAGFDKPVRDGGPGPTCNCVSYASFGHSGFTGTIAWADPEKEVVYIFLSNRVYPDAANKKLIEMNIRTSIQQVIYNAVERSAQGPSMVNY